MTDTDIKRGDPLTLRLHGAVLPDLLGDAAPPWHELALCAQVDPEAFFPRKGQGNAEARAICGQCGVRAECLADALEGEGEHGVWGGTSEKDRRKLRDAGWTGALVKSYAAAHDGGIPLERVHGSRRREPFPVEVLEGQAGDDDAAA